jgi:hypothetical protein
MQKVILGKKEGVYGPPMPRATTAANAAVTRNFSAKPIETDRIERNIDTPTRGRSRTAPSNRRSSLRFELELAGSGAVDTVPAWMEYLEACGMAAPVVTAATRSSRGSRPRARPFPP